jgi:hypothetical protein
MFSNTALHMSADVEHVDDETGSNPSSVRTPH